MKRILTIVGLIFLVGCSVVLYSNYIAEPTKPIEKVYIDTCFKDTTNVDSLKTGNQ
jgi:hypothetical protein